MGLKAVKVGVIGCGFIAQSRHLPALLKCQNVEMPAVCDKNKELAENVATKFKIGHYHTSVAEMLQKEHLNMVDICTATPSHASLAIQAMEAGCHVLTEKPIASSVTEADAMIRTAERMKVKLCVSHDMLFTLTISRMKRIVERRELGEIVRMEIKHYRPKNDPLFRNKDHWMHRVPGGMVIGDDLIHPLYISRAFLGDIEPVAAFPRKISDVEHVPLDEIQVVLKGKKGWGNIVTSYNAPQNGLIVDIWGTEQHLHGELFNCILFKYEGPGTNAWSRVRGNMSRIIQILGSTTYAGSRAISGGHRGGHEAVIEKFIAAIVNNTEPPVTAADGKEIVRILEQVVNLCEKSSS
jgi:predicted dehydrogenase